MKNLFIGYEVNLVWLIVFIIVELSILFVLGNCKVVVVLELVVGVIVLFIMVLLLFVIFVVIGCVIEVINFLDVDGIIGLLFWVIIEFVNIDIILFIVDMKGFVEVVEEDIIGFIDRLLGIIDVVDCLGLVMLFCNGDILFWIELVMVERMLCCIGLFVIDMMLVMGIFVVMVIVLVLVMVDDGNNVEFICMWGNELVVIYFILWIFDGGK